MTKQTAYICDICGTTYNTEEEAIKCEEQHKICKCKKYKRVYLTGAIAGYGKVIESVVDYQKKELQVYLDDDDCKRFLQIVPINYCPFCGRNLSEENKTCSVQD